MPESKTEEKKTDSVQADKNSSSKHLLVGIMVGILVVIILGSGAALMGLRAKSRLSFSRNVYLDQNFQGGHAFMNGRGGFGGHMGSGYSNQINGKVTAVNDKKFTMDLGGSSKDVQISDSTRFPIGSTTTVKVGDTVVVIGQQDSNGVVQATEIVINPVE